MATSFDAEIARPMGFANRFRALLDTAGGRAGFVGALALIQAILISFFYDTPRTSTPPSYVVGLVWEFAFLLVQAAILAIAAFAILNWHQRHELLRLWQASRAEHRFGLCLLVNLVVLGLTVLASLAISASMETYLRWLWPYFGLLAVLGTTLLLTAAPWQFWRDLFATTWMSLILAVVSAVSVLAFSALSAAGWEPLAGATLHVSHAILSLYESNIYVDVATKRLGVEPFMVEISPGCSGYEGVGLVTAVLALYLFVFRKELAFPQALFLIPIGIAAIWFFNALRISALVSLGAHFSPTVAIGGFHSQAGWIAFLIVTVAIMVMAHRIPFFHRAQQRGGVTRVSQTGVSQDGDALTWLAPFMALMTASIIASAFAPNDQWLYGLRVVLVAAALWTFRDFYKTLVDRVSPLALVAGVAVGVAWIATDPNPAAGADLGAWILALPAWAAVLWLTLRALGTIIFVPIAEELAFRGFLHRVIASYRVPQLSATTMLVIAFAVTSIVFGLIHSRWIAGMAAGAIYALVMYRSGRISDPVAAHMASNAVIIAWAIHQQQWSLI